MDLIKNIEFIYIGVVSRLCSNCIENSVSSILTAL